MDQAARPLIAKTVMLKIADERITDFDAMGRDARCVAFLKSGPKFDE